MIELLLAPPVVDGKWLVRIRPVATPQGTGAGEYILGVVFHGKATHHLLMQDPKTGNYTVNKRSYGPLTTLDEVLFFFF